MHPCARNKSEKNIYRRARRERGGRGGGRGTRGEGKDQVGYAFPHAVPRLRRRCSHPRHDPAPCRRPRGCVRTYKPARCISREPAAVAPRSRSDRLSLSLSPTAISPPGEEDLVDVFRHCRANRASLSAPPSARYSRQLSELESVSSANTRLFRT